MAKPFLLFTILKGNSSCCTNLSILTLSDYGKDIIELLLRAPEGLSIRKIVRHVYNAHNTLFETVSLDDVKREVKQYLTYRSKLPSSPIVHSGERGIYKLNPNSQESQQLMLQFKDESEIIEEMPENDIDTSIDMFEGMY